MVAVIENRPKKVKLEWFKMKGAQEVPLSKLKEVSTHTGTKPGLFYIFIYPFERCSTVNCYHYEFEYCRSHPPRFARGNMITRVNQLSKANVEVT